MLWFFDFLGNMMNAIGCDQSATPSEASKVAYEKALGPHHPFVLRQAAKLAMKAAPSRQAFKDKLFATETPQQMCDNLIAMDSEIAKLRERLWKFFKDNNISDLP